MRNKHKEMALKEKERCEKSCEKDWNTEKKSSTVPAINVDCQSVRRKKCPVQEVYQQELIGGILFSDERGESVQNPDLAETCMRSKYNSQVKS